MVGELELLGLDSAELKEGLVLRGRHELGIAQREIPLQQFQRVHVVLLLQLLQLDVFDFPFPAGFALQPLLHLLQVLQGRRIRFKQIPLGQVFSVGLFGDLVAHAPFLHVLEFLVDLSLRGQPALFEGGFARDGP